MKNFELTKDYYVPNSEHKWIEILPVIEEQSKLLFDSKGYPIKGIDTVNLAKESKKDVVDNEKLNLLKELYNNLISDINSSVDAEIEEFYYSYELINVCVSEVDGVYSGIMNFRQQGEHKQIRF